MEEILLAVIAGALSLALIIIQVSIRPWKYCISKEYKNKINNELSGKSKTERMYYIFGGFVAILSSILVVAFLVNLYFSKPEQSTVEKLEVKFKNIIIESLNKEKER